MTFSIRRLTTERSATVILFLLIFAIALRVSGDTDMWWHLRSGQKIAETGQFIYPDSFSFTFDGVVHDNHSAVSDLLMYLIWSNVGLAGLSLFTALIASVGMGFVYASNRGTVYLRAFLLVIGATTAAPFWTARPQMFTYLFATILLWLLYEYKRNRRDRLWWIPPLLWCWANLHGGYFIAYLIIGAVVIGEIANWKFCGDDNQSRAFDRHRLLLPTLASIPLLLLNPLGPGVFAVPLETLGMPELRRFIAEWQSPDFSQPRTWSFPLLLFVVLAALRLSRSRVDFGDIILLSSAGLLSLVAARNVSLFAVVAVPIASYHLDDAIQRKGWILRARELETPGRLALNLILILLVAAGVCLYFRYIVAEKTINIGQSKHLPVAAVDFLNASSIDGNMFNSYNWGGYVMFHVPEHRVFIDGRTDLYGGFLNEYYRIAIGAPDWNLALANWNVDFALIETESGLARAMSASNDWRKAYQDDLASLFVREG